MFFSMFYLFEIMIFCQLSFGGQCDSAPLPFMSAEPPWRSQEVCSLAALRAATLGSPYSCLHKIRPWRSLPAVCSGEVQTILEEMDPDQEGRSGLCFGKDGGFTSFLRLHGSYFCTAGFMLRFRKLFTLQGGGEHGRRSLSGDGTGVPRQVLHLQRLQWVLLT